MTQEERQQRMREMGIDGDAAANRQGRVFMNRQGSGGFAAGAIISKDDSSITIKLGGVKNGENQGGTSSESGSKIIFFPIILIEIKNKDVVKSYINYFNLLWKLGK